MKFTIGLCTAVVVFLAAYFYLTNHDFNSNSALIEVAPNTKLPPKVTSEPLTTSGQKLKQNSLKQDALKQDVTNKEAAVWQGLKEERNLLQMFLDGELEYERVTSGELFEYLVALWDGESSKIDDPIYDIDVIKQVHSFDALFTIKIMKKATQEQIDDFRLHSTTTAIDELIKSDKHGMHFPEMEIDIQNLAADLTTGYVTIESLVCKELKCAAYVVGNSVESFDEFKDALSTLSNYSSMILHPGDPKQAQIFLNKKASD